MTTPVRERCAAALHVDELAVEWAPFDQTRLGQLVAEASTAERATAAAWVQESLFSIHRSGYGGRRVSLVKATSWALRQRGVVWPAEVVERALHRARGMIIGRPAGGVELIELPRSALTALSAEERAGLAGLLRWYADHADVLRSWPGAAGLRRWFERLLPPQTDSPDPHHAFTDACPLAHQLRQCLTAVLETRGVLRVLEHCDHPPLAPKDEPGWQQTLTDHLAAGPEAVQVLRTIAETAIEHRPTRCQVYRQGRLVTRLVWAEPATLVLLYDVVLALGTAEGTWVDPLLGELAGTQVTIHPARRGRRAPLLRSAVQALEKRGTLAAAVQLERIHAAPDLRRQIPYACQCREPIICPHWPR